ncbi:flagellar assembly protein FliH [Robbsia sp. KACC 23696]|uniref:flagellar assembly protein FliH n=1 Tax=Robbsia sp. KACC 23696 TaxID=3149231 RepID=UPI00325ACC80
MSDGLIPKERLSAYQRWEMASFDPVPEPVEDPLEAPRAAARLEGYAAGHEEGHRAGFETGRGEGFEQGLADARAHAAQLAGLVSAFSGSIDALDAQMAESLLTLALEVAKTVVRQTVDLDPTAMLGAVREVLSSDPPLVGAPVLLVNPADQPLIDAYLAGDLAAAGWSVRADSSIERGGCRAKAVSGEIDATLATRWSRVAASLGREQTWAENGR